MRTVARVLLFILIGLTLTSCGKEKRQTRTAPTAKKAPDFSATDLNGREVKLSDFRGKVVLLDFWAPWCRPCLQEVPELQKIFDEYRDKGVVVIGASAESPVQIRQFKQRMAVSYLLLRVDTKVLSSYQVRGIPTTCIIDGKGYIRYRQVGFSPEMGIEEKFREIINNLVSKTEEGK